MAASIRLMYEAGALIVLESQESERKSGWSNALFQRDDAKAYVHFPSRLTVFRPGRGGRRRVSVTSQLCFYPCRARRS